MTRFLAKAHQKLDELSTPLLLLLIYCIKLISNIHVFTVVFNVHSFSGLVASSELSKAFVTQKALYKSWTYYYPILHTTYIYFSWGMWQRCDTTTMNKVKHVPQTCRREAFIVYSLPPIQTYFISLGISFILSSAPLELVIIANIWFAANSKQLSSQIHTSDLATLHLLKCFRTVAILLTLKRLDSHKFMDIENHFPWNFTISFSSISCIRYIKNALYFSMRKVL